MIRRVLKNKEQNKYLQKYGYVVIDFVTEEQVETLHKFYNDYPHSVPGYFHTTHFSCNFDYKRKVHNFILQQLQENVDSIFNQHRPIFANFMVKESGESSLMPLHADWTYVDEDKSSSYSIWLPLVDTTIENGCLGVVPFSHHLTNKIRGPHILQWEHPLDDEIIRENGKLLPLSAGQAVIFNHKLLHFSPPNTSEKVRPAINISIVPYNTDIVHYAVPDGQDEILKFNVSSSDFYIQYNNFEMPQTASPVERFSTAEVSLINLKYNEFVSKYYNPPLLKKILMLFN